MGIHANRHICCDLLILQRCVDKMTKCAMKTQMEKTG